MATRRNWTAVFYMSFYWTGIVMVLACLALILVCNTDLFYRFEHTRFPLSWMVAIMAVLAFLAAELCHPVDTPTSKTDDEDAELIQNWEAIEV